MDPVVRPLVGDDRSWVRTLLAASWGVPVVSPGGVYDDPAALPGFVADLDGERAGAVTCAAGSDGWEVVTLEAVQRRSGVGRALIGAVIEAAADAGGTRVWLVTTDDNDAALAFYDRVGFVPVGTHRGFIEVVRARKPHLHPDAFVDAVELEWRSGAAD
jgi:ribosomal protein S18 acetylase RimI-like enzyme